MYLFQNHQHLPSIQITVLHEKIAAYFLSQAVQTKYSIKWNLLKVELCKEILIRILKHWKDTGKYKR
jgi:hypothetical protein